jgi:hypothetical protein
MKKFVCTVCGYVHEGDSAPEKCPQCKVPAEKFKEQVEDRTWAAEHVVGVASGGGTGRTLYPDNMAAGPASYGMTDTLGRMHGDAQFAGSSSVPHTWK